MKLPTPDNTEVPHHNRFSNLNTLVHLDEGTLYPTRAYASHIAASMSLNRSRKRLQDARAGTHRGW